MAFSSNQNSSSSSGIMSRGMSCRVETGRGRPKFCSCGEAAALKTSRTPQNPGRLFYGCPSKKEDHLFKWTDESMLEDIENLKEMVNGMKESIGKMENEMSIVKNEMSIMKNEMKSKKELAHNVEIEVMKCTSELQNVKNMMVWGGVAMVAIMCWVMI